MFTRTRQALDEDRAGFTPLTLVLLGVLVALWLAWFFGAPLTVHEVSARARIEVSRAVQPVEAPVNGSVIATARLALGTPVQAGDVILELDAQTQRLSLLQCEARLDALKLELDALAAEREVQLRAIALEEQHGGYALNEAWLKRRLAALHANQAHLENARARQLLASGYVSLAEAQRAATDAKGLQVMNAAAATQARLVKNETARNEVTLRARIAELDRALSTGRGEAMVEEARARLLRHEIEQRSIRANATGRISEVANVHAGSYVTAGMRLATILAPDDLRVVADFEPSRALGRLSPGQVARVHLVGFPAVEYGYLPATVRQVATELRDGLIRVELDVDAAHSRVPLQHGLPASVSVEFERATSATLALRAVGVMLAPRAQEPP